MNQLQPESEQPKPERNGTETRPALVDALLPNLHRLVPLLIAMLLVTEAILGVVVIFSRMSALQQFVCVVLIVVLPAAVLALAVSAVARASRTPAALPIGGDRFPSLEAAPWTPGPRFRSGAPDTVSTAAEDLSVLVEQMEEASLRIRRLPFNIIAGLDEEQFTYWLVKLRATANSLADQTAASAPRGLLNDGAPILAMEHLQKMQDDVRGKAAIPPIIEAAPGSTPMPDSQPPSLGDARTALKTGDSESAIRGLKELLLTNADDAEAAELLGVAYERAGDMDSALESMRVAVLIDPKRASSHYNYAVLLAKVDRLLDAYRQNEVALRLNPGYAAARAFQQALHSRIVAQRSGASHAVVESASTAS